MQSDKVLPQSRVCHMCWMDKPIHMFLNRSNTRYCKICRSCRNGQLLRYYEKKKSIPMIRTLKKEMSINNKYEDCHAVNCSDGILSSDADKPEFLKDPFVDYKTHSTTCKGPCISFLLARWVPCDKPLDSQNSFLAKRVLQNTPQSGCF